MTDSATASELFENNRCIAATDLPKAEGFFEPKNKKPGFLAEIRASACCFCRGRLA